MKNNQANSEDLPMNDLGRLLACQHLMDDFLKYAINPKLSAFSKDDKLRIVALHREIDELVIQLRINHSDCSDLISEMFLPSEKQSDFNIKTLSNGKK